VVISRLELVRIRVEVWVAGIEQGLDLPRAKLVVLLLFVGFIVSTPPEC
jgi:hypothetical protein